MYVAVKGSKKWKKLKIFMCQTSFLNVFLTFCQIQCLTKSTAPVKTFHWAKPTLIGGILSIFELCIPYGPMLLIYVPAQGATKWKMNLKIVTWKTSIFEWFSDFLPDTVFDEVYIVIKDFAMTQNCFHRRHTFHIRALKTIWTDAINICASTRRQKVQKIIKIVMWKTSIFAIFVYVIFFVFTFQY